MTVKSASPWVDLGLPRRSWISSCSSHGRTRIAGALANLNHQISDQTVGNILKAHGIEPAPKRHTTWATFLKAHWDVLAAVDFTTMEVWTRNGLVTFHLLFVIELKTRRVHFASCTPNPNEAWMTQVARNLTDSIDGFLLGKRYVLMDRDGKFSPKFRGTLDDDGAKPLRLCWSSDFCATPAVPNMDSILGEFCIFAASNS